jgi:hypothetical protein
MPRATLNQITFLAGTLKKTESITKEFDVSFMSLDNSNMSEGQYKFILARFYSGDIAKVKEVLNGLCINPVIDHNKKIIK